MSLIEMAGRLAETAPLPDAVLGMGMRHLVGKQARLRAVSDQAADERFAMEMERFPIADQPDQANAQHYEVPADFFAHALGVRRKYSSCLYPQGDETLNEAEAIALQETCAHAQLADGQDILELGCGWGSLSLWMAARYPHARITSVSNSASQRAYIESQARLRGFANLRVVTADMNAFAPEGVFDRIVSVEMFEHMANWRALLSRARGWLRDDGRLFIHIFTHNGAPYRFDHRDKEDWIAQHFFTGGIMPSHGLIRQFPDLFEVEDEWRWSGAHYARTARQWLENFDASLPAIAPILRETYGNDAALWQRRWRMFFLAVEALFDYGGGDVWGVSHYRLKRA